MLRVPVKVVVATLLSVILFLRDGECVDAISERPPELKNAERKVAFQPVAMTGAHDVTVNPLA